MDRERAKSLGMLGGAALALLLLAASLHEVVFQPGRRIDIGTLITGGRSPAPGPNMIDMPWLPAVIAILLVIGVIGLIVSRTLRRELRRNLPSYLLLMLGIYLMAQSVASQAPRALPQTRVPVAPDQLPQPTESTSIPELVQRPPEWLVVLITIILLAACAATVIVLFRRLRQREPAPLDRLVEEAQGALKELRSGADLRDTISRCYAEMMRVISEQQGVNRDPSLTPREFEQRLAAVGLGDMHIRRLTRLFERVRYSPHPPGPPEEHEAEECLAAIIASHHTRRPLR